MTRRTSCALAFCPFLGHILWHHILLLDRLDVFGLGFAFINHLNHSRVCLEVDLRRPEKVGIWCLQTNRVRPVLSLYLLPNELWTKVQTKPAKCECALKPKVYFTFYVYAKDSVQCAWREFCHQNSTRKLHSHQPIFVLCTRRLHMCSYIAVISSSTRWQHCPKQLFHSRKGN